jgi:hypothetical protein
VLRRAVCGLTVLGNMRMLELIIFWLKLLSVGENPHLLFHVSVSSWTDGMMTRSCSTPRKDNLEIESEVPTWFSRSSMP